MPHDLWRSDATDPRADLPDTRGEKVTLAQYLDHYRLTVEMKCERLTAEQLAARSVPPSTLSLLGLLRHLARVEQSWTRRTLEGNSDVTLHYGHPAERDRDFDGAIADTTVVAEAWSTWRAEIAHSRAVLAGIDLSATVEVHGAHEEVRSIIVHLIEEYARHVGHADLLRECIDGRAGQ